MEQNLPDAQKENKIINASAWWSTYTKWMPKILVVIVALFLLQIPFSMIEKLAGDRHEQEKLVQESIAESWGGEQKVNIFPKAATTEFNAEIIPEIRSRGIYQAVIYTAKIKINAEYKNLQKESRAQITVCQPNGLGEISVTVNGKETDISKDLIFPLPRGNSRCEITFSLRGNNFLGYGLNADSNIVNIKGAWGSPSFVGDVLPETRTVDDNAFSARWSVGKINKAKMVGVELCIQAGAYQQSERCLTYATFFLFLFFFVMFAAELVTKTNIHLLQYLVASGASVLFYLMLLAFSEKIGFTAGYAASAAIIVGMITMYARMFLGKMFPALVIGAFFAGSYLLKFLIVQMYENSLVCGSLVLAIMLFVLMLLTGKINRDPTPGKSDLRQ